MDTNTVITNWKKGTTEFECINPNGISTILGTGSDGEKKIASPKAIMLASLAVCSGLDVIAILKKMRVELDNFKINFINADHEICSIRWRRFFWHTYKFSYIR